MLIWLPAAAIPYLYVLAWLMAYGRLMRFVRWAQNDHPPTWGNRLAVVLGFNFHLHALGRARVHPARELAEAPSYDESRAVVRRFRTSIQSEPTS